MAVETIETVLVPATVASTDGDNDADDQSTASPYDLTDLATVKDELNLSTTDTSNDAFLSRAITQASTAIANYCNRVFAVETVQDEIFIQQDAYPWQTPGGVYPLQLSRWPIANSGVAGFTGNTHSSLVIDNVSSVAGVTSGSLIFASDGSIPAGTSIENVGTRSLTLSAAATGTAAAVGLNTGLQVIQTLSVNTTQALVHGTDYTIDAARGWLIRLNPFTGISEKWEAVPVTVVYQGGYSAIPADLTDAVLRLVTARFKSRGRDPMLVDQSQGPNLGSQRWWVGTVPGQKGPWPQEILGLVDRYRVPIAL